MSYDVDLEVETGPGHWVSVFSRNYTSNVSDMWRKAGLELHDFVGQPATSLEPVLARAIEAMKDYPDTYIAMNPENGWGDYQGCVKFLTDVWEACLTHSFAIVEVSS